MERPPAWVSTKEGHTTRQHSSHKTGPLTATVKSLQCLLFLSPRSLPPRPLCTSPFSARLMVQTSAYRIFDPQARTSTPLRHIGRDTLKNNMNDRIGVHRKILIHRLTPDRSATAVASNKRGEPWLSSSVSWKPGVRHYRHWTEVRSCTSSEGL